MCLHNLIKHLKSWIKILPSFTAASARAKNMFSFGTKIFTRICSPPISAVPRFCILESGKRCHRRHEIHSKHWECQPGNQLPSRHCSHAFWWLKSYRFFSTNNNNVVTTFRLTDKAQVFSQNFHSHDCRDSLDILLTIFQPCDHLH